MANPTSYDVRSEVIKNLFNLCSFDSLKIGS